jgi:hypothetical protein
MSLPDRIVLDELELDISRRLKNWVSSYPPVNQKEKLLYSASLASESWLKNRAFKLYARRLSIQILLSLLTLIESRLVTDPLPNEIRSSIPESSLATLKFASQTLMHSYPTGTGHFCLIS